MTRRHGPEEVRTARPGESMLTRVFPFLAWFRGYTGARFRTDLVSGLTVALVLIPQSMAYAQLAGLKPYYGLYASFLPPIIAALFGSSRQLATGPVAIVSLMTAATLEPLATAGSDGYVAYAIMLALAVGVFQLALGVLRLGVVINFLSHPVVNGFTNAAAIIIATSQLSKIFGVHVDKGEHHYETIIRVCVSAWHFTHWPTLALAALAFGLMLGLRKINPKIPYVLAAVVVTTVISWAVGFEHKREVPVAAIQSEEVREEIAAYDAHVAEAEALAVERTEVTAELDAAKEAHGRHSLEVVRLRNRLAVLNSRIEGEREAAHHAREHLRAGMFRGVERDGELRFYPEGEVPDGAETDGRHWRVLVGVGAVPEDAVKMSGGGDVVGSIPKGLPALAVPTIEWKVMGKLLGAAVIISLLGFMEAISIAKAISVKTGQRVDANQELIGQGLANILGAVGRSYPVSGSFSRSAVNFQAGATTGVSSAVTSLMVAIVLLFFTPLLFHLPQSVLAAVIMLAVLGLVNVSGFVHAFRAKRADGVISVISFVCTLAFAPHLDRGILIGVGLSVALFLYEYMRPRVTFVARHPDGSFRDIERWGLGQCRHVLAVRFYGKLFFANTAALEKRLLEAVGTRPELRHVIIVGNGISDIDASGEETLDQLVDELRDRGLEVSFSGLRDPVLDVMARTRLLEKIGEDNIYPNLDTATRTLCGRVHAETGAHSCALLDRPDAAPDGAPGGDEESSGELSAAATGGTAR